MDNGTEYTRAMKNQKRSDSETPSSEWNWMQEEEEEVVEGVKYLRAGRWRDGCRYSDICKKKFDVYKGKSYEKGEEREKEEKSNQRGPVLFDGVTVTTSERDPLQ